MGAAIAVTVWGENWHDRHNEAARRVYPEGMHTAIARGLAGSADLKVRAVTLDQPDQGLPDSVLGATDVLTWWGHVKHADVDDALVDRVQKRVLEGMA